jgi:hypothetical protein
MAWAFLGAVVIAVHVFTVGTVRRAYDVRISGATWAIALASGAALGPAWSLVVTLGSRPWAAALGGCALAGFSQQMLMLAFARDARSAQERRDDEADALCVEALDAYRATRATKTPFALYLRAFDTTNRLTTEPVTWSDPGDVPSHLDLELALVKALQGQLPLIAAGRPDDIQGGAGRIPIPEHLWQQVVLCLAETASLLIVVPSANAGTLAELAWIRERGKLGKTLFVMPQHGTSEGGHVTLESLASRPSGWPLFTVSEKKKQETDHQREWDAAVVAAARVGLALPPYQETGALFTLTEQGEPRSVVSLDLPTFGPKRTRLLREKVRDVRDGRQAEPHSLAPLPGTSEEVRFDLTKRRRREKFAGRLISTGVLAGVAVGVALRLGWPWLWVCAALMFAYTSVNACVELWRYESLRFDHDGVTLHYYRGFLSRKETRRVFPWREVSAAFTGLDSSGHVLAVVPVADSPLHEQLKDQERNGKGAYVVAPLASYGIAPEVMAEVLERYAGGRHGRPATPLAEVPAEPVEMLRTPTPEQEWLPGRTRVREPGTVPFAGFLIVFTFAVAVLAIWYLLARYGEGFWYVLSFLFGIVGTYALARGVPGQLDGKKLQIDHTGLTIWEKDGRTPEYLRWESLADIVIDQHGERPMLVAGERVVDLGDLPVEAVREGLSRYSGGRYRS